MDIAEHENVTRAPCPECGEPIAATARHCVKCGAVLSDAERDALNALASQKRWAQLRATTMAKESAAREYQTGWSWGFWITFLVPFGGIASLVIGSSESHSPAEDTREHGRGRLHGTLVGFAAPLAIVIIFLALFMLSEFVSSVPRNRRDKTETPTVAARDREKEEDIAAPLEPASKEPDRPAPSFPAPKPLAVASSSESENDRTGRLKNETEAFSAMGFQPEVARAAAELIMDIRNGDHVTTNRDRLARMVRRPRQIWSDKRASMGTMKEFDRSVEDFASSRKLPLDGLAPNLREAAVQLRMIEILREHREHFAACDARLHIVAFVREDDIRLGRAWKLCQEEILGSPPWVSGHALPPAEPGDYVRIPPPSFNTPRRHPSNSAPSNPPTDPPGESKPPGDSVREVKSSDANKDSPKKTPSTLWLATIARDQDKAELDKAKQALAIYRSLLSGAVKRRDDLYKQPGYSPSDGAKVYKEVEKLEAQVREAESRIPGLESRLAASERAILQSKNAEGSRPK